MNFWIANDPELAPPFTLVKAGYDVWLGNNRGTRFGRGHTELEISEEAFWDFDYIDMGLHDVPSFIDFILAKTG